jgi:hypothetical protein
VVRGFGRAHGYLVRAELVTWGADEQGATWETPAAGPNRPR